MRKKYGFGSIKFKAGVLEPEIEAAAMKAYQPEGEQPAFTYLANYILAGRDDKRKIPYSTVTGVRSVMVFRAVLKPAALAAPLVFLISSAPAAAVPPRNNGGTDQNVASPE